MVFLNGANENYFIWNMVLILPSADIMSEFQSMVLVRKSSHWCFLSVVICWYKCEIYFFTCFCRNHLLCERMDIYLTLNMLVQQYNGIVVCCANMLTSSMLSISTDIFFPGLKQLECVLVLRLKLSGAVPLFHL